MWKVGDYYLDPERIESVKLIQGVVTVCMHSGSELVFRNDAAEKLLEKFVESRPIDDLGVEVDNQDSTSVSQSSVSFSTAW